MSSVLAFADTQIGASTVDLQDQRDVLDRIVQVALERDVDAVVHGGDVYEGPIITPEQTRLFIDGVRPLRDAGIPLLICTGNGRHDAAVRSVHALDVLREVDGIQVSDAPSICMLADKVVVCTLPWVHPGRLVASMNGALTHEEADLTTAQMLVRIAEYLHEKSKRDIVAGVWGPADLPTVLLAHWAISGSALPTGLSSDQMGGVVLPWADLDAIGYDAIVGAHVHQPQQISQPLIDQTLGIVVGSPQQLNFGEKGEHGCWVIALEPNEARRSAEFVHIQSKQFVTLGLDDLDVWAEDGLSESIVRIRYEATEDEARRIDHDLIRQKMAAAGASRVTIEPTIVRKERARAQQISEQLTPIDALAAYCEANDVEPDRALAMLARLKEWSE